MAIFILLHPLSLEPQGLQNSVIDSFQRLGELQPGDRFIVDMGYGSYEYEMRESEIVAADDTTVITPRGEEVLTLSTCYPFSYIGSASERYIIYAYPVAASDAGQE